MACSAAHKQMPVVLWALSDVVGVVNMHPSFVLVFLAVQPHWICFGFFSILCEVPLDWSAGISVALFWEGV